MFFGNSIAFLMTQHHVGFWSLVPLPFLKTSLNIRKFTVHELLKPGLENFEHYFTSMWDECYCAVVRAFLALPFFGIVMKTDHFQSCGHCWVFQICWHTECSTFTAACWKPNLYIWKFLVHVLLKPDLEGFEHHLAGIWSKCGCTVVWTRLDIAFLGNKVETGLL